MLLLDETTSSLDTAARRVIEALLMRLKSRCTIVVVSHYLDQIQRLADTVYELSSGKLLRR